MNLSIPMTCSAFVRHARRAPAISAIAGASLSAFLPASAQDAIQTAALAPVVVTAGRLEQPLAAALPSTRVIERDEIERHQPADLPALLRMLTSVDIAQSGPLGSQTSVFLRGADSRQTLVLVDGVPINRADFGIASVQHLPVEQIERIEIVRGNVSSLYGAQAVGGVIQVFTRRAGAPQASAELGARGTRAVALATGTRFGDAATPTELSASLSTRRSDGFSAKDPAASPGANPDRDGGRQHGGSARLAQTWAPGHVSTVSLQAGRTRSDYDGFAPGLSDVLTTTLHSLALNTRHALGRGLELSADLGQVGERFDDPTGFAIDGRNRVRRAGLQLQWQPTPGHTLQAGAETGSERFSDSNTAAQSRRNDALRLAWLAAPTDAAWETQLALRHDDNETYGSETTGLLALAWRFGPHWKASLQAANAFSAPSLVDEQYANPLVPLKAERSRNAEAALQWSAGATLLRAAWFVQRQRDRVAFDPVTFEAGNLARASNRGLELLAQATLGAARLGAEATFQDPRDDASDTPLKRRARNSVALRYAQESGPWHWGGALRHVGKRLDTDPATFADAWNPARTTADLTLGRRLGHGWQLAAKLENLGDSERPDVLGYNAAPRGLFVALRWDGGTR